MEREAVYIRVGWPSKEIRRGIKGEQLICYGYEKYCDTDEGWNDFVCSGGCGDDRAGGGEENG